MKIENKGWYIEWQPSDSSGFDESGKAVVIALTAIDAINTLKNSGLAGSFSTDEVSLLGLMPQVKVFQQPAFVPPPEDNRHAGDHHLGMRTKL
jgi:hypothetical protein